MDADRQKLLDDLKVAIQEVEGAFRTLVPGISGHVPFDESNPDGPRLGFQKHGSHWQTYWQVVYTDGHDPEPLLNKSLKVRLEAVPRLPDLYTRLCLNEEAQTEQVEQAVKDLRSFTAGLLKEDKTP